MSLFHVPMFVSATNPSELVVEMLRVQKVNKITFRWHSITKAGNKWYAWYDGDATQIIRDKTNDGLKKDN